MHASSRALLRLNLTVGRKKAVQPIPSIIPVSKSTWWADDAPALIRKGGE